MTCDPQVWVSLGVSLVLLPLRPARTRVPRARIVPLVMFENDLQPGPGRVSETTPRREWLSARTARVSCSLHSKLSPTSRNRETKPSEAFAAAPAPTSPTGRGRDCGPSRGTVRAVAKNNCPIFFGLEAVFDRHPLRGSAGLQTGTAARRAARRATLNPLSEGSRPALRAGFPKCGESRTETPEQEGLGSGNPTPSPSWRRKSQIPSGFAIRAV